MADWTMWKQKSFFFKCYCKELTLQLHRCSSTAREYRGYYCVASKVYSRIYLPPNSFPELHS